VPFTEIGVVEKPIINWLKHLGWAYITSDKLNRDAEDPFDLPILKEAIKRLNPAIIQGDNDVDNVINHLKRVSNDISGNREFFDWIRGEKSIVLNPGEKAQIVRLIDTNPENNVFVVTNQFKFSGYENVRFDIVLMVNGIPLAMIEAKGLRRRI